MALKNSIAIWMVLKNERLQQSFTKILHYKQQTSGTVPKQTTNVLLTQKFDIDPKMRLGPFPPRGATRY